MPSLTVPRSLAPAEAALPVAFNFSDAQREAPLLNMAMAAGCDVIGQGNAAEAELRAALARLPGRRLVFTNGDAGHAERVLAKLGIDDLFEATFHIASADYIPKPAPRTFARMTAAHDVDPTRAAFFEDSAKNLGPAAAIGMTTVLVGPHAETADAPFVHYRTRHLAPFLAAARVRET